MWRRSWRVSGTGNAVSTACTRAATYASARRAGRLAWCMPVDVCEPVFPPRRGVRAKVRGKETDGVPILSELVEGTRKFTHLGVANGTLGRHVSVQRAPETSLEEAVADDGVLMRALDREPEGVVASAWGAGRESMPVLAPLALGCVPLGPMLTSAVHYWPSRVDRGGRMVELLAKRQPQPELPHIPAFAISQTKARALPSMPAS